MPLPKAIVVEATIDDIPSIVALHMQTFKKKFTTKLGADFLLQYYKLFLHNGFYLLIVKTNNEVSGFISGVEDYTLLSKSLKKNFSIFIYPILKASLTTKLIPEISKKIYNFLLHKRVNKVVVDIAGYNEITSFCISPENQGKGLGSIILKHYIHLACQKSILGVFITTDAINNSPTISFYKKNKFIIKHTYSQSIKREMHLMIRNCSQL